MLPIYRERQARRCKLLVEKDFKQKRHRSTLPERVQDDFDLSMPLSLAVASAFDAGTATSYASHWWYTVRPVERIEYGNTVMFVTYHHIKTVMCLNYRCSSPERL